MPSKPARMLRTLVLLLGVDGRLYGEAMTDRLLGVLSCVLSTVNINFGEPLCLFAFHRALPTYLGWYSVDFSLILSPGNEAYCCCIIGMSS